MKLWLLKTDDYNYDEYDSFVIAAETEDAVRTLAHSQECHGNDEQFWRNPKKSTCELIAPNSIYINEQIVCSSFNAG